MQLEKKIFQGIILMVLSYRGKFSEDTLYFNRTDMHSLHVKAPIFVEFFLLVISNYSWGPLFQAYVS